LEKHTAKVLLILLIMFLVSIAVKLFMFTSGAASDMIGPSPSAGPRLVTEPAVDAGGPEPPGMARETQPAGPAQETQQPTGSNMSQADVARDDPASPTREGQASEVPDGQVPKVRDGAAPAVQDRLSFPEGDHIGRKGASLLRCIHYNENDFMWSVNDRSPASDQLFDIISDADSRDAGAGTIMGGVVPHHLLARRLIAEFFRELAEDPPETVIVIGPNHKLDGIGKVQVSSADWGTPFGVLETDTRITAILAEEYGSAHNDELFENEHSVSSLVPYIKYFLPDAKIVPVLLHGNLSQKDAVKLGSLLGRIMSDDPGTIMIASIDFSHYLSTPEADRMDIITWKAISSWDLDAISRMGNDNLDSVPSMTAMMAAMDMVSARSIEMTGHNNSSRITKSGYDYTTSYFTMFFRKDIHDGTFP
jgi:AmmeMemoRadiSam system protein B